MSTLIRFTSFSLLLALVTIVQVAPRTAMATPPPWEVRGHTSATLPPETDEIRLIEGQLVSVQDVVTRCPRRPVPCRSSRYFVARLKFTLNCVNDAAVVGSSLKEMEDGSFQLKVSALELSNPRSLVVRCAAANVVTVDVPVPTSKKVTMDNLEVVFSTRLYLPN